MTSSILASGLRNTTRLCRLGPGANKKAPPMTVSGVVCKEISSVDSGITPRWKSHRGCVLSCAIERSVSPSVDTVAAASPRATRKSGESGSLLLTLAPRAVAACDDAVNEFCKDVPVAVRNQKRNSALDVSMSRDEWTTMAKPLGQLLSAIVDGWKRSAADN